MFTVPSSVTSMTSADTVCNPPAAASSWARSLPSWSRIPTSRPPCAGPCLAGHRDSAEGVRVRVDQVALPHSVAHLDLDDVPGLQRRVADGAEGQGRLDAEGVGQLRAGDVV